MWSTSQFAIVAHLCVVTGMQTTPSSSTQMLPEVFPPKAPPSTELVTSDGEVTDQALQSEHNPPLSTLIYLNRSRIVGGEPTQISTFPHQVAWLANGRLRCGASILSTEWVITAGHCAPSPGEKTVHTFRVGSTKVTSGGKIHKPAAFHRHPNYDSKQMDWDLMLVRVTPSIQMSSSVAPIRIESQKRKLSPREVLIVTGWGNTLENFRAMPTGTTNILQKVEVYAVDQSKCARAYRPVMTITEHMICAAAPHKDACQGDSGGPLMTTSRGLRLLGLVSFGIGCARETYPGVYTDLRHPVLQKFIQSVTGINMRVEREEETVSTNSSRGLNREDTIHAQRSAEIVGIEETAHATAPQIERKLQYDHL